MPVLALSVTDPPWQKVVGPAGEMDAVAAQQFGPVAMVPLIHSVLGMTSATSSAYSQLPGVLRSQMTGEDPEARITNRTLNMSPLKATGVRLNQAALN